MDKEKSIKTLRTEFERGERLGRIVSKLVTFLVPLVVLLTVFAGTISISNQYTADKEGFISEIGAKNAAIENNRKEIENLKNEITVLVNENETLENELSETEEKKDILAAKYRNLQKKYNRLVKVHTVLMALEEGKAR